jgi:hypothetical protein
LPTARGAEAPVPPLLPPLALAQAQALEPEPLR